MTPLAPELARRDTAKARVLAALREAGPRGLTNVELVTCGGGLRAPARVHELQHEDGYAITVVHEHDGQWRYTLTPPVPHARFVPPVGMPVYHDTPRPVRRSETPQQRGLF